MPMPPKSPSALLRSLGADNANLEAKTKASAKEAELRWPLFRALAPVKAAATPRLSDEAKAVWDAQKTPTTPARKPLLSRPGLGSKLAASLEKMAPSAPAQARAKLRMGVGAPPTTVKEPAPIPVAVRAKAKTIPAAAETPPTLGTPRPTLFATAPATEATDDSLSTVFSRVEGHPPETRKSRTPGSSTVMRRIGKR